MREMELCWTEVGTIAPINKLWERSRGFLLDRFNLYFVVNQAFMGEEICIAGGDFFPGADVVAGSMREDF